MIHAINMAADINSIEYFVETVRDTTDNTQQAMPPITSGLKRNMMPDKKVGMAYNTRNPGLI